MCFSALEEPTYSRMQGLSEPLKVRTITKGATFRTSALQMLQKSLHTHLKRIPEYKFIGETFSSKSCKIFREKIHEKLNESSENFILNGDYSAATDHLKIDVVHIIGEMIIKKL